MNSVRAVQSIKVCELIMQPLFVKVTFASKTAEELSAMGIPTELFPAWIPEGYELIEVTPIGSVLNKGVAATYTYKGREQNLHIDICEYYDSAFLYDTVFEKNAGAPEEYQSNGRRFYLFRNVDTWTAVWSDGRYSISLGGMDSRETAVSIIDSIPELVQEQTSES